MISKSHWLAINTNIFKQINVIKCKKTVNNIFRTHWFYGSSSANYQETVARDVF